MAAKNPQQRMTFFLHAARDQDLVKVMKRLPYRSRSQYLKDALRFYHEYGPADAVGRAAAESHRQDVERASSQLQAPPAVPRPRAETPRQPPTPEPRAASGPLPEKGSTHTQNSPIIEQEQEPTNAPTPDIELDGAALESMQHLVAQF